MKVISSLIIGSVLLLMSCDKKEVKENESLVKFGEKITLHSNVLNEDRDIWISLPKSYHDQSAKNNTYPVLYLLDGNAHFQSVSSMIQILSDGTNGTYVIPEMIVVAIPNTDRTRDLTPTHSELDPDKNPAEFLKSSGGGDNFLKFIKEELIPKVDSDYRTFPYRVFVGHSFGGIAVINALYTIPETFNAYVAIDPSMWWDDKVLVKRGAAYFNTADLKGKTFVVTQANTLDTQDTTKNYHFKAIKEYAALLKNNNQSGMRWNFKYYENDSHGSVPFVSEYDALRFIFENYTASFEKIFTPQELTAHYQRLSDETKVKFIPPENIVQQFGDVAIYRKRPEVAKEFYQLNIDTYPNSPNVYAKMGEYWETYEDKTKALEYYEIALKLSPESEDIKNRIEKLKKEKK